MIIDKIENAEIYHRLSDKIITAFNYIKETDLSKISSGRYEIDKKNIFALVQEYDTKNPDDCKLESHFNYIDLQYIISGAELMGIKTLINDIPLSKNEENDIAFYDGYPNFFKLNEGMFAIFFPDDLHMPGIKINQSSKVKKVVIKIRV